METGRERFSGCRLAYIPDEHGVLVDPLAALLREDGGGAAAAVVGEDPAGDHAQLEEGIHVSGADLGAWGLGHECTIEC